VPGRHRKTSKIALRITTGAVAGAAFAGSVGVAYAHADSSGAANAAATLPSPAVKAPAAKTPAAKAAPNTLKQPAKPQAKQVQKAPAKPAAVKITAAQVIALAKKQVGVSEDGSGNTKFQSWYMTTPRAKQTVARDGGSVGDYAGAEWCDMFVSWVGNQAGLSTTFGEDPYTVTHAQWFQAQHRWGTKPTPGAVVFFSWSGSKSTDDIDHVGIVIKDNGDGTIQTVEGNTAGGKVAIQTRDTANVVGYGYPAYAK
jgi:surface antigen